MKSTKSVALGLAILVAAAGCRKNGPVTEFTPPPPPVTAVAAMAQDVPLYFDEIGRAVALEMVSVQPQISGRVVERHFTDGADVKAGDPLFTIDPRPFQAQLDAAEAALAQQQAVLDLARIEFARVEGLVGTRAIA